MDDLEDPARVFGAKLRAARKRARLTQTVLAERIHSTQSYISNAEQGKENPPLLTIILMAEALDCSPLVDEAMELLFVKPA